MVVRLQKLSIDSYKFNPRTYNIRSLFSCMFSLSLISVEIHRLVFFSQKRMNFKHFGIEIWQNKKNLFIDYSLYQNISWIGGKLAKIEKIFLTKFKGIAMLNSSKIWVYWMLIWIKQNQTCVGSMNLNISWPAIEFYD